MAPKVLEWDVRVPLVSNAMVLVDVLLLLAFLSATLAGLVLFLTGFQSIYDVLRLFIIADSVFIVVLFMVMGYAFTNLFKLCYRLDEEGVLVRVGEFDGVLNHAAWVISSIAQRFSFTSSRVFKLVDREMFVPWGLVTRAVFDDRRRVATLTSDVAPLMRIYCIPENVEHVFTALRDFIPEPDE